VHALCETHAPEPSQTSWVHSKMRPHDVPAGLAAFTQPVAGLHASVVHALPSLQGSVELPLQAPLTQRSPRLQGLPSLQVPPSASGALVHEPPLQVSVVQGLPSLHAMAVPAAHAPASQWSPVVHGLPSLHPAALGTCMQPPPGTHTVSVQGLLSGMQVTGLRTQVLVEHAAVSHTSAGMQVDASHAPGT